MWVGRDHMPTPMHFPSLYHFSQGHLSVRSLTGTVTVGQQHPWIRAALPGKEEGQKAQLPRLLAYVMRHIKMVADKNVGASDLGAFIGMFLSVWMKVY